MLHEEWGEARLIVIMFLQHFGKINMNKSVRFWILDESTDYVGRNQPNGP